jgi:hypothetical protein
LDKLVGVNRLRCIKNLPSLLISQSIHSYPPLLSIQSIFNNKCDKYPYV